MTNLESTPITHITMLSILPVSSPQRLSNQWSVDPMYPSEAICGDIGSGELGGTVLGLELLGKAYVKYW
jgi:hypothetical protein